MKTKSDDDQFSYPKESMMLWEKFLAWFAYTTIGLLLFIVTLGFAGILVGDRLGKFFLAVVCSEAAAGAVAIVVSIILERKIFKVYLYIYGENASDNYNRCWKYHAGSGGFWGIICAIIFFFLNVRAWNTFFRS